MSNIYTYMLLFILLSKFYYFYSSFYIILCTDVCFICQGFVVATLVVRGLAILI